MANQPANHMMTSSDGRTIAVDTYGPTGGRPVVFIHPAPGSRRLDPDPAVTDEAGVRLITIDRPGYGGSSPMPEGVVPTVAGLADDVAHVVSELGVDDVATVGWSAGGRIAVALAARHPDVVRAIGVVATPAPDEEVPWVPDDYRQALEPMKRAPETAIPALSVVFEQFAASAEGSLGAVGGGPADDAVLAQDEPRARLVAMLEEAYRQGAIGMATDVASYSVVPWGFDPTAAGAPATLFYGDADPVLGTEHGQWWADRLGGSNLRILPGVGHMVPMVAWREILASVT